MLVQSDTPKGRSRQQKTDDLLQILFTERITFSRAAEKAGLSRQTAYRYFDRWKQSEEAKLVDVEWWQLFLALKDDNPEKALECLTRLKYRMTTEHSEHTERKFIIKWTKDDSNTGNQVQATSEATAVSSEQSTV